MEYACLTCGAISSTRRCPDHTVTNGTSWNGNRDRGAQARFRKAVLKRDHYRCTDCGSDHDLRACHVIPLAAGGSNHPSNGRTRCKDCDQATDPHAR